uniref:Uncharacterized protein n=1 Tax=Panagrolaimus superbus TaxID=310955 RepID=A0A914Y755_9BILA
MSSSLKLVLNDFADWSSAAGIPQIAYAFNRIVRALWFIIWIGLFAVTIYQFYLIVSRFLSYPMKIVTNLQYGAQDFPVVTFCNNNPLIYSKVKNITAYKKINDLMEQYQSMVKNNYGSITGGDPYGLNTPKTRYEKTEWANEALVLLMNQLTEAQKNNAMYKFGEVIKVCSFNGIECTEANFTSYYDATFGRCFQFNSKDSNSNYRTLRAGSGFGLQVLMLINQFDPNGDNLFLPTTSTAGAKIGINLKGEDPAMESYGISVPVGQETLIGLEFVCL